MKKKIPGFYIVIAVSVIIIIILATGVWKSDTQQAVNEDFKTRIIAPGGENYDIITGQFGQILLVDNLKTKIPLESGEIAIAILNKDNEASHIEEQFVIYRNINNPASPIYIAFFGYDERIRSYRRMWNEPTAASRPETTTLFSQDLIGDRNNCIIVTGMNANNEHTMTVFRTRSAQAPEQAYHKIAELQITGSIVVQETGRSLAYQQGMARGQSYNIAAYGHDITSTNILDQIETIFSYNPTSEQYEQTGVSRIPGRQIEQQRLRELLSGRQGVFEEFIQGLWYFVGPRGTIDTRQYLYFNPSGKEIVFFGDEAQQIYRWQSSSPTRYGLYIRSQNISISTLLRFIDIELESLESIKIRVTEDVRLKILVSTTWDGSYRRAGTANFREAVSQVQPTVDSLYDSSLGRIQFDNSGEYSISSSGNVRRGRYVFYRVDDNNLLELRPSDENEENRLIYKIEHGTTVMILSRVRLGINGIQDLLEPPITLTPVISD
ncbi:MAG: pallilysin-related adhesin [Treponema sp.]|nr:pallilysin-related adhesin [Treponema sp.]